MSQALSSELANMSFAQQEITQGIELLPAEILLVGRLLTEPLKIITSRALRETLSDYSVSDVSRKALVSRFMRKTRETALQDHFRYVTGLKRGVRGLVYLPAGATGEVTPLMIEQANTEIDSQEKKGKERKPKHWKPIGQIILGPDENFEAFGTCAFIGKFEIGTGDTKGYKQARLAALLACSSCEVIDYCLQDRLPGVFDVASEDSWDYDIAGGLTVAQQRQVAKETSGGAIPWNQAEVVAMRTDNFNRALLAYQNTGI